MSGQISKEEKSRRLHILQDEQKTIRKEILEQEINNSPIKEVLFETYKNGMAIGHTSDFIEVWAKSDRPLHAQLKNVRLLATDGEKIEAELL